MRRITFAAPLAIVCVLVAGASCDSKSDQAGPTPEFTTVLTPTGAAPATGSPATAATRSPAAPAWPSPEDCKSHNPANVKTQYAAGIHAIMDGSTTLMRLQGGPEESLGQQGLALAKRFRKHCFLGRNNTREDKNSYIFDYWLEPTGANPTIPDQNCSNYNRNNLMVNDMGSGHGWRVKDNDNVLHVFDTEADAKAGKLVASKYNRICFIGRNDGDDQEVITYFL